MPRLSASTQPCSGDGQRVDDVGPQRGVDRCQPAALAVADEVDLAPQMLDRAVEDLEVVVDGRVLGLGRRADPVEREETGQAGGAQHLDLALGRAVVDDAGVVAGLGREHEGRDDAVAARGREVAQPGDRRRQHDLVGRVPARAPARGGDGPPAREVTRQVERARAAGGGRLPVVERPLDQRAPRLDAVVGPGGRERGGTGGGLVENGCRHVGRTLPFARRVYLPPWRHRNAAAPSSREPPAASAVRSRRASRRRE